MIIAVFQGEKPTGGYEIDIIKIVEADSLTVFANETLPQQGCPVIFAITRPYHIVKIAKTDKEAMFSMQQEIEGC
jgi:hypothetical protein